MKRIITLLLSFMLILSLVACGSKEAEKPTEEPVVEEEPEEGETEAEETAEAENEVVSVVDQDIKLDLHGIGERSGKYTGDLINDLPEGKGKFVSKNSSGYTWWYEGDWVNGQMEGNGITCWPDNNNQTEEGQYVDSELVKGKLFFNDVLAYDGEWSNNQYNGQGTLYNNAGEEVYTGTFTNNKPSDEEAFKASVKDITFDSLARDAHLYQGDVISVSGEVIQVLEGEGGYCEYRIALDDVWEKVMYADYVRQENESRILEGDNITVYGISNGLITYESTMGQSITIPSMTIYYFHIN